jgi:arylsulfatase A-like enzyme
MKSNKKPNILFISIDSLRADHLSAYGYPKETSPHLAELAFDGTTYDNAISAANWTGASLASILTGLYPTCHGFTNKRYYLDNGEDSIASILQKNGYFTTCFSNNMYLSSKSGLDAGFDEFYYRGVKQNKSDAAANQPDKNGVMQKIKDSVGMPQKNIAKNMIDLFSYEKSLQRDDGAYATEVSMKNWILQHDQETPFLAYVHYQEPHSIYFPPYPYRRRFFSGSWRDEGRYLDFDHINYFAGKTHFTETQVNHYQELYDGEIAYLDWRLGRLFQFMKKQNIMENTVVVVTADHGEMFGEGGFFWHAFCLYESLIRVPLIIRYPDWFERDARSLEIVQTNDLTPTLLDGIGIDWKYKNDRQGQSFLNGSTRKAALTETFNPELMIDRWRQRNKDLAVDDFRQYLRDLSSYRTNEDKFIFTSDGAHEFFDLQNDPGESDNLFEKDEKRVKDRQSELQKWIGSFTPHVVSGDTQPGFDKATWEKMRTLGYA